MSEAEKRPHRIRHCPVGGCDWTQVTSWWLTPTLHSAVDNATLEREATAHILTHAAPIRTIIT